MHYLKILTSIIFCFFVFSSVALAQDKKAPPPPGGFPNNQGLPANSDAPDLGFKNLNGKEIKLDDYRGEYILIDFWGTWCKPCLEEIPYLKQAFAKYSDKINFISIAVYDNEQKVIDYVHKNDIGWTQIVLPSDAEDSAQLIEKYNVRIFPSTFLIKPDGTILNGANSPEKTQKLRKRKLLKTLEKLTNNS